MQRNGWEDVSVIAVETKGADSLAASMTAGQLTTLPAITSIANTLGALQVTPKALEWTQQHPIQSAVVSDAAAVNACLQFADEMRIIVEPACGASLSLLYDNAHLLAEVQSVLVIVCGGAGVTMDKLTEWSRQFA
jgi:L-serine/L-threonine ammonia-lyase